MSRSIDSTLLTVLASDVLELAICIKITREDGTIYGFTSHDQDITFSSQVYEAASGAFASSIRQTTQGVDNMEVIGLLMSNRITDNDILAGRYDNAQVELFLVNYTDNPPTVRAILEIGYIGEIVVQTGYYQAEFRSLGQRMNQHVAEITSPFCRVRQLFDARCSPPGDSPATPTATPSNFRMSNVPVLSVVDVKTFTLGPVSGGFLQAQYMDNGKVTFASGLNNGIAREVRFQGWDGITTITLFIQESFPFTVSPGDLTNIEAGCDRLFTTCVNVFNNAKNFRGEPHLPGNDKIIRWGRRH